MSFAHATEIANLLFVRKSRRSETLSNETLAMIGK